MLANPRAAAVTWGDGLWVRPVDLPAALTGRSWSAPADVVVEVADGVCPWNAGRWRLTVDVDGAQCTAAPTAEPDLSVTVAELGAALLGGTTLLALAAAGRVTERRAGSLRLLSRAASTDVAPWCPIVF